jgi:hypothetical protein
MDEQLLELTRQVTILNERLPNHIEFTERNIADHETRIRTAETELAALHGTAETVKGLVKVVDGMRKQMWIAYGALVAVVFIINVANKIGA